MKLIFTQQALVGLQESLNFLPQTIPSEKINEIRDRILSKIDQLVDSPHIGQQEEYLKHLGLSHRRLIDGQYKVIYRVQGDSIYITDIFDSRQDPSKMKG